MLWDAIDKVNNVVGSVIDAVKENPGKTAVIVVATAATGGAALIWAAPIAGTLGGAGLLGAASTGTAISTLSGAALTNASLAALGGGALSAGGAGIVGGTAVVAAAGAATGTAVSTVVVAAASNA